MRAFAELEALRAALRALPRRGWVEAPAPITSLPALAGRLGARWLGVKRDDLIPALHGGTKVRKLDHLLAAPPFAEAPCWASVGAIGSGHLVALTAAATVLGRRLHAHLFWEPISAGVLDNLAFTASGPTELTFSPGRIALAVRRPRALLGPTAGGLPVIPPGATLAPGMVGLVRAALELAAQVEAGELPAPDHLYVPLGSGGTVAGLLLGLGVAGLPTHVHAVATVERPFASVGRLRALAAATRRWLSEAGVALPDAPLAPVTVHRAWLGPGYGVPTPASEAACAELAAFDVPAEPIYSGKALAALLAASGQVPGNVLYWLTPHGAGGLPHAPDWRDRLPPALRARLDTARGRGPTRRHLILGGAAVAGAVALGLRLTGYPPLPGWTGRVLAPWEGHVLRAAAEALLAEPVAAAFDRIPDNVDRFLVAQPKNVQRDVHGLLAVIEHGTPLGGRLARFTRQPPAERRAWLESMAAAGGLRGEMYRGLRDLCMLGYYQEPATWPEIGYGGPWVPRTRLPGPYDALVAPADTPPRGWTREA